MTKLELFKKFETSPSLLTNGAPTNAKRLGVTLEFFKEAKEEYLNGLDKQSFIKMAENRMAERIQKDLEDYFVNTAPKNFGDSAFKDASIMTEEEILKYFSPIFQDFEPTVKDNVKEKSTDTNYSTGEIKGEVSLEKDIQSDQEFFNYFGLDSTKYEISRVWAKSHKQGNHTYSVFFKPKSNLNVLDLASSYKEFLENFEYQSPAVQRLENENAELLGVLCLFDLHLGKLSPTVYTNDYSTIGTQTYLYLTSLRLLLERSAAMGEFDKFVLLIGNDFFNSEYNNATTKGTPQDTFIDKHHIFKQGLLILTMAIWLIIEYAPVDVIYVPSNHDEHIGQSLAISIEHYFKNNKNVTFDCLPMSRKYYKYGVNGFMFEHGELKAEKYAQIFPQEGKEIWSTTEHHEVLLGHLHSEKSKEVGGIGIYWLSSLSCTDKWHYKNGYVGAKKRAYLRVYDKEMGKIGELVHVED